MGWRTDFKIDSFRAQAGLNPTTPQQAEALSAISEHAARLIEICALEKSGIRDGDGNWYGSDPLRGTIQEIQELIDTTDWLARAA